MTLKIIVSLLTRISGFDLILTGMSITLVVGVMLGSFVGLMLKDMGYPDHITLLFPLSPMIIGGIIGMIGLYYDGKEEKIISEYNERSFGK